MQLDLVGQKKPNLAAQASTDNEFEAKLAKILEKLGFDTEKAPEFWVLLMPVLNDFLSSEIADMLSADEIIAINMEASSRQFDEIKLGSMYALAYEDKTGSSFDSLFEKFLKQLERAVDDSIQAAQKIESLMIEDQAAAVQYIQQLLDSE